MSEYNFPTEIVELPSKGLIYPKDHPLSSGKVEMKYMTAKEEDILTNKNYIDQGIVLDKLLESMTMKKFDVNDIHVGDKNALYVAIRILGYGKDYSFSYKGKEYTVDLTKIENKPFDVSFLTERGTVEFSLPSNGQKIEFKFLTEKEEDILEKEIEGYSKINKNMSPSVTTRLKHVITSVDGNTDKGFIKGFVDNMLAIDSLALRKYLIQMSPDIDLKTVTDEGEEVKIPIGISFFWPDF